MSDAFTEKDRVVLKDVRIQVRGINGKVKRHEEEIFGSVERKTSGINNDLADLKVLAVQLKTAVRVVVGLMIIIGFTNILVLFR